MQIDATISVEAVRVSYVDHSERALLGIKRSTQCGSAGIVGVIIWIAVAFWPVRVARRKAHSFFGYFLLSLLFFPLP